MMDERTEILLTFLLENKSAILQSWREVAMFSPKPPSSDQPQMVDKGAVVFDALIKAYTMPKEKMEVFLQDTGKELATVKIRSGTGIDLLVYNINIGKSVIYSFIHERALPSDIYTADAGNKISYIMDHLSYYTVRHYMLLKDRLQEEENRHMHSSHEDRLTLLGQMTSSFVHEFRNPLTTVQGFVQLLKAEYPELPYMEIIAAELEQLEFRITQFLMLSKKQDIHQEKVPFSLNHMIEEVASFVYPRLLELKVSLEEEMEENLYVIGIPEEVRQVIINIIFNAIEVMAEHGRKAAIHIRGYRKGDTIFIEASNTGPKIPQSLIKDIFEPFVTTKKTGTGLGLYVSRQIIEKHGGQLDCKSEDEWTTFTISFPALMDKADGLS